MSRSLAILRHIWLLAIHHRLLVLVVESGVGVHRLPIDGLILVAWCLLVDNVHVGVVMAVVAISLLASSGLGKHAHSSAAGCCCQGADAQE